MLQVRKGPPSECSVPGMMRGQNPASCLGMQACGQLNSSPPLDDELGVAASQSSVQPRAEIPSPVVGGSQTPALRGRTTESHWCELSCLQGICTVQARTLATCYYNDRERKCSREHRRVSSMEGLGFYPMGQEGSGKTEVYLSACDATSADNSLKASPDFSCLFCGYSRAHPYRGRT